MKTKFFGDYKDTSAESIAAAAKHLNSKPARQGSNQQVRATDTTDGLQQAAKKEGK